MKFIDKKEVLQYIPAILFCFVVSFPAWAFGGTQSWAIYTLLVLSLITFGYLLAMRNLFIDSDSKAGSPYFRISVFDISALLTLILIFIQAVNPSHSYSLLNQGLTALPHIVWLPSSVSRMLSMHALLLLMSYFLIYKAVCCGLRLRSLYILIGVIVASAVCMSILALLQGSQHARGSLVGMFLNDNNFAAYINLILPVVLGSARTLHNRAKRNHSRSNPSVFVYFCAGILATAVLFTGSRAGAVITMLILAVWVFMEIVDARRSQIKSKQLFLYPVLALIPVALLLYLSGIGDWFRQLANPVTELGVVVATRWMVMINTWQMFLDRIAFGVGAGAFHAAFPYYQDATVSGFYRNAHNDWIQWLAELGIVGCSVGAVALAMAFRRRVTEKSRAYLPRYMERGIWIGLAGVSLHSMLDFPFRIPAISVVVAVWIGLLTKRRCRSKKREQQA